MAKSLPIWKKVAAEQAGLVLDVVIAKLGRWILYILWVLMVDTLWGFLIRTKALHAQGHAGEKPRLAKRDAPGQDTDSAQGC